MNDAPAPITPAAKALLNAARVRDRLTAYEVMTRSSPVCPEISEAKGKEIAPHLVELCRMVVEDWYQCSPTPQPLSNTIINIRDCLIFAAREEKA
jgi:hypothetical protein